MYLYVRETERDIARVVRCGSKIHHRRNNGTHTRQESKKRTSRNGKSSKSSDSPKSGRTLKSNPCVLVQNGRSQPPRPGMHQQEQVAGAQLEGGEGGGVDH